MPPHPVSGFPQGLLDVAHRRGVAGGAGGAVPAVFVGDALQGGHVRADAAGGERVGEVGCLGGGTKSGRERPEEQEGSSSHSERLRSKQSHFYKCRTHPGAGG